MLPVRFVPTIKEREELLYTPSERDYADMIPKATGEYMLYKDYVADMRKVAELSCPNPCPVSRSDCQQEECVVCKAKELVNLEDRHSKLRGYKK